MVKELITLKEAAKWASKYLNKNITESNISYLSNYGRVEKFKKDGRVFVNKTELKQYYDNTIISRINVWEKEVDKEINWNLAFTEFSEKERTKHVHRLHPYKGKFIPQLVEYFLDNHVNDFKKQVYFKKGDIILDPFVGSGTTLVQSLELGIHSVGIDISEFNCLINRVKIANFGKLNINSFIKNVYQETKLFTENNYSNGYFEKMDEIIKTFNQEHFPSPGIKRKIINKEVDELEYSESNIKLFFQENPQFERSSISSSEKPDNIKQKKLDSYLGDKYVIQDTELEAVKDKDSFINKWYTQRVQKELLFYNKLISKETNKKIQNVMKLILSRVARSTRATKHIDLGTLKEPVFIPYYCRKHRKICKPVYTILPLLKRYTSDTINRIDMFSKLRKNVFSVVLNADSRYIDVTRETKRENPEFAKLIEKRKIDGIFTSPPYVGQIDYHEQHAYAYELLSLERKDDAEIGPQSKGDSKRAKEEYVKGISDVLLNLKKFFKEDAQIFMVANDKHNLYPEIAKKSGLIIKEEFLRPVLHRTEADTSKYSEKIFRMQQE